MSVPIYFVADASIALRTVFDASKGDPVAHALEFWERHGLGHIVSNHGGRISGSAGNGPDNTSGVWVTVWPEHSTAPKPLGYHPAKQTWLQVRSATETTSAVYFGHTAGEPPKPEDLSLGNPYHVSGSDLQLCDGNIWIVPEIREPLQNGMLLPTPVQGTSLPKLMKRDLNGDIINPVKAEFESLWEESGKWFDIWCELHFTDRSTFNAEDALAFAVRVLQLRYRICDLTNDALGLLDVSNFQQIIATAIGWAPVQALLEERLQLVDSQKKSQDSATAEKLNGSCGPEDSGHIIDPLEANNTARQDCAVIEYPLPPEDWKADA